MPTWREARAAKVERLKREQRYYTPDKLGRPCPVCGLKMPLALIHAGIWSHPTCEPTWKDPTA